MFGVRVTGSAMLPQATLSPQARGRTGVIWLATDPAGSGLDRQYRLDLLGSSSDPSSNSFFFRHGRLGYLSGPKLRQRRVEANTEPWPKDRVFWPNDQVGGIRLRHRL